MSGFLLLKGRGMFSTEGGRNIWAAGMEWAPGRGHQWRREVSFEHDPLARRSTYPRDGRKKCFRVRVHVVGKQHFTGRNLNHFTKIHDRNFITHVPDNREVVGDEYRRQF